MGKTKQWEMRFSRNDAPGEVEDIANALSVTPLTAALLYHRGCRTPEKARRFIRMEAEHLNDPFLLTDMKKAALRVLAAMEKGEKTVIYGDYDADGVTATAVLYLYLKSKGAAVDYFIPDRFRDGYGMNERATRELIAAGNRLIITVDNGITATGPIALAKQLGADVVVTDHHEPHGALPEADAVVDPHREGDAYPFKALAGVGVAFKLICAIEALRGEDESYLRTLCYTYLDLVAFGTVADVMPLTGENRLIVSMGLHVMGQAARPGLKALSELAAAGKKLTATSVSFTLAPRVNAAGRLGSAMRAVELLLTESAFEASRLASELCEMNRERQNEENAIFTAATERMQEISAGEDLILVLDREHWHGGVTGIVASRLTERYARPTFLITYDGGIGKGSARSVPGVNLMALLSQCDDLLIQYGGHEMAAGLTVERGRVDAFRARINEAARALFPAGLPDTPTEYDCEIAVEDVNEEQIAQLSYLEPCGTENPSPLFLLRGVKLFDMTAVGGGRHTRLQVGTASPLCAMYFGVAPSALDYQPGDRVDMLVRMELNTFGGRTSPQLQVKDMRHVDEVARVYANTAYAIETFLKEDSGALPPSALPNRADLARVYRRLQALTPSGEGVFSLRALAMLIFGEKTVQSIAKTALSLAVFAQVSLLTAEPMPPATADSGSADDSFFALTLPRGQEKRDLFDSPLFRCMTEIQSSDPNPERN